MLTVVLTHNNETSLYIIGTIQSPLNLINGKCTSKAFTIIQIFILYKC